MPQCTLLVSQAKIVSIYTMITGLAIDRLGEEAEMVRLGLQGLLFGGGGGGV